MGKNDVSIAITADSSGVKKGFQDAETAAGSFDSKMGAVSVAAGMAIYNIAVKVAELALDVGKALPQLGSDFHDAFATMRVSTGETGAGLANMKAELKDMMTQTPAGMNDIATALSTVHQRLDMTGPKAEAVALQFLRLTGMTGEALAPAMKSATGALQNWNISADATPGKLDEMFRATQQSGISFTDLTGQMSSAGVTLQALGFTFDQSIGIISNLSKYGLDSTDVMAGLKKELADSAKHGISAKDSFNNLLAVIKNAPSDTAAADYAMQHLGQRSGPQFAALVREGKFNYQDMMKAISDGSDTINQAAADTSGWQAKLGILVNMIKAEVEPMASAVFDAMTTAAVGIKDFVKGLIDAYNANGLEGLVDKFKEGIGNLRDWFATTAWPTVRDGALKFLGAAKDWIVKTAPEVAATMRGWFHSFTDWASGVWNGIEGDGLSQKLATLYGQVRGWIEARAPQVKQSFVGWFHAASDWASGVWNGTDGSEGISQKLGTFWGSITGWITDRKDQLLDHWKEWVHSATQWLDDVVQKTPENLDKVLKAIDDWCNDPNNLSNLADHGMTISGAVVKGILGGFGLLALKVGPFVFGEMGKVVGHIMLAVIQLPGKLFMAGVSAVEGFVKGIVMAGQSMRQTIDHALQDMIPDWARGAIANQVIGGYGVGGHAIGGVLPDGMSMVGEQGPELAVTQGGLTRIVPNSQIGATAGAASTGQVLRAEIHNHTYMNGREISHTVRTEDLALL